MTNTDISLSEHNINNTNVESLDSLKLIEPFAAPEACTIIEGGGVTSPRGFLASAVHAGFRKNPERNDLALVVSEFPAACAATFTQNVFCAAPVTVCREHFEEDSCGSARALIVNSGVANAATGETGLENAREMAAITARALAYPDNEVMLASTGVIGVQLPMECFQSGVPAAAQMLSKDGGALAARAIMTTDTHPKEMAVSFSGDGIGYDACNFVIGGMVKGSGMIMPNMATMIACITTDAPVAAPVLRDVLRRVVAKSFNKVTVDSDTSTNDSCFIFANAAAQNLQTGKSQLPLFEPGSAALKTFEQALLFLATSLAREMAADGEGATKLLTVAVSQAASDEDADLAARAVANSPLVKTAVYGKDANWGRIAAALGKSGARFRQEDVDIDIMGIPVCRKGLAVPFSEEEALRRFERPEIELEARLGAGNASTVLFTCDYSHDYITINGDYRT